VRLPAGDDTGSKALTIKGAAHCMCGFCGFAGEWPPAPEAEIVLDRMTRTLHHRGPDDSGTWTDPEGPVALGHRRLSILDLSPLGHQPMHSSCGRYVIAFNGEIYNFAELREELEKRGRRFRGRSDTEVMLEAFSEWGLEKALQQFNGMFAFALWDRLERRLHLVRDRLGEKPLYYGWSGKTFLFGSEPKALRVHPAFQARIDRDALALYLRHNYVPAPISIYMGVFKLPPGTFLSLDPRETGVLPEPQAYWSAKDQAEQGIRNEFTGSEEEISTRLETLLKDAVRLRMVADVPLGVFLSGGIDSSMIAALMQVQSSRPVRTFSIGFRETGFDEAAEAKRVARHLGTEHTELYLTPGEATATIPLLPALYDEPFADSSQIPTYLVASLARRQITVSLSGDGGDELFGGYNRYLWVTKLWRRFGWLPGSVRSLMSDALRAVPQGGWDGAAELISPLLPRSGGKRRLGEQIHKFAGVLGEPGPERMYLNLVSQWKLSERMVLGAPRIRKTLLDDPSWTTVSDVTQQMMLRDLVTYLPDDILVKVDRATMGVSLEARVPFLDHRLVEFAFRIPLGMKVRNGEGKWILRQLLYRHVPREMIERPKMGFGIPIGSWLRGPLRPWAEELLSSARLTSEEFFDPKPIRARWTEHLSGRRSWGYHLWTILMFQAWHSRP
jgi:asparagine synthase (glutamine-hydrolysing)